MPAIVDSGATDESVAHRPRGGLVVPVRSGPVRRGSRREQRKSPPILAYASLVALVAFAGLIVWLKLSSSGPKPVGPTGAELDAQASFQNVKNLVRQGKWKDAKVDLDELAISAPDLEGLSGYVKAAQVEVPLQQHLDDAEMAIVHGELGKAASELREVPDASKQFFRRGELDVKLGKAVDEKLKEAAPLGYQTKDKEKMRKLKALAEDMLAARATNRDAQQLLSLANSVLEARPVVEAPKDPGDPSARVMNEYTGGNTSGGAVRAGRDVLGVERALLRAQEADHRSEGALQEYRVARRGRSAARGAAGPLDCRGQAIARWKTSRRSTRRRAVPESVVGRGAQAVGLCAVSGATRARRRPPARGSPRRRQRGA